jgi:hypothetical protein
MVNLHSERGDFSRLQFKTRLWVYARTVFRCKKCLSIFLMPEKPCFVGEPGNPKQDDLPVSCASSPTHSCSGYHSLDNQYREILASAISVPTTFHRTTPGGDRFTKRHRMGTGNQGILEHTFDGTLDDLDDTWQQRRCYKRRTDNETMYIGYI